MLNKGIPALQGRTIISKYRHAIFSRHLLTCGWISIADKQTLPIREKQTYTGRHLSHRCYSISCKQHFTVSPSKLFVVNDTRFVPLVNYHLSSRLNEDAKSIADKTVQILSEKKRKEQLEEKKQESSRKAEFVTDKQKHQLKEKLEKTSEVEVKQAIDATKDDSNSTSSPQLAVITQPLHVRAWRRTVKELKHYYHGFRLLFIDVKICTRYIWGVLHGKTLTRRERKQLVRTTADLFRLVPFMVFIIIPFMEFLLPVALKLFPGLLPSTFAESDKEKEKVKKRLKAKLEMAKFLQDTVEESAMVKSGSGKHPELAKEFQSLLVEIREGGTTVQTDDILKFTQLFTDDITLDNMTRDHLLALCKMLELNTLGTNRMLAFKLRVRLRQLKADDKMILHEGLGSLSDVEMQAACRARGMRAIGVPTWRLRFQLKQWLDMHLNDKIPISLLLMSRALYLPENLSKEEQLKTVISTLPESTTAEAEIHAAEVTGEKIDPAAKIKLIKAEEEAIAREKEEEAEAEAYKQKIAESKPAEVISEQEDLQKYTIQDKAEIIDTAGKADIVLPEEAAAPHPVAQPPKTKAKVTVEEDSSASPDEELSSQDIEKLEDVIELIVEEKNVDIEKSSLDALKEDVDEYQEDLSQLKSLVERDAQIIESKSAKRLSSAVNRMIGKLTHVTDDLYKQKQHLLEEIEVKQVRLKRSDNQEAARSLEKSIEKEKDTVISINELVLSMKRLQKVSDETKLQKIAEILDEDHDGIVNLSEVLQVLQEIGTENVNIQSSQMTEILRILKLEDAVEKTEQEKKDLPTHDLLEKLEDQVKK